ncbi:MAG: protein-methionine-sulfoxide reductase catalytic subunit MsrP [Chloroflexales bacterium]|nr:protein-methionine-sulfoxide reductase catalytic subunit MsrP [Chloroflexales bacterium]
MRKIPSSEITPEHTYLSRRAFLGGAGALSAAALLAACGGGTPAPAVTPRPADGRTDDLGDPLNSLEQISNYNNYYEFTTDKEGVARLAQQFQTSPWEVQVGGMVGKPRTFGLEDLLALGQEERIYRLRCVEAWSMVIPWSGFPLGRLLAAVEPQAGAKYVRFETVYRPEEMPGQRDRFYPWPYVEGLRLDEAMHDLTLLATGLYGQGLAPQNGGPVRLVVPWKYGFKSIKAIAKIDLVAEAPTSLWMALAPNEYGFYANVNPEVDHPRWSQASERRIGELRRRPTLPFNGYADEVAALYAGMDLREHY